MNYEFHVGDYVEDVDGHVGYISEICTCEKCIERGWYEPSIRYTDGTEDYISHYDVDGIPTYYKRIGAYEFTKKEKKKIEPMPCVTSTVDYGSNSWIVDKVIESRNKINELVDAVNKLRDKEDSE